MCVQHANVNVSLCRYVYMYANVGGMCVCVTDTVIYVLGHLHDCCHQKTLHVHSISPMPLSLNYPLGHMPNISVT